jgi:hypothetical protein
MHSFPSYLAIDGRMHRSLTNCRRVTSPIVAVVGTDTDVPSIHPMEPSMILLLLRPTPRPSPPKPTLMLRVARCKYWRTLSVELRDPGGSGVGDLSEPCLSEKAIIVFVIVDVAMVAEVGADTAKGEHGVLEAGLKLLNAVLNPLLKDSTVRISTLLREVFIFTSDTPLRDRGSEYREREVAMTNCIE